MGAFFHAGALGGRLSRLVEEPALVSIIEYSQSNSSLYSPIAKYPVLDFANKSENSFQFPNPMKPKLGFQDSGIGLSFLFHSRIQM
jgi:hypothetical protein